MAEAKVSSSVQSLAELQRLDHGYANLPDTGSFKEASAPVLEETFPLCGNSHSLPFPPPGISENIRNHFFSLLVLKVLECILIHKFVDNSFRHIVFPTQAPPQHSQIAS